MELVGFSAVEDAEWWDGHDDFANALYETRRGGGIVFGYVANSRRQIVARLGRYDDAHYSRLALA